MLEENTTPAEEPRPRKQHHLLRATVFVLILGLLMAGLNALFQPRWYEWNNYHTHEGFYQQPNDTVEAIFLGASLTVSGFIPTHMYEEQGVCTYNLGTEIQPTMASYYWTKEAYRLHGNTLKVVMLDASQLRKQSTPAEPYYHKAFDRMRLSPVKIEALQDLSQDSDDFLTYLIPSFAYHDRWASLGYADFIKNQPTNSAFYRGYNTTYHMQVRGTDPNAVAPPLTEVVNNDERSPLNAESLTYYERLVTFCREHGLQLVVFATPTSAAWSDAEHNAVEAITGKYQVPFLDFEVNPLLGELGFNPNLDTTDGYHMGHRGAVKLSSWIARYLREQCGCTDVRGDARYAFMDQQVSDWHAKFDPLSSAINQTDPTAYISDFMKSGNYSIFVTVKDDATRKLTSAQRKAFWDLGLVDLSTLGYRDSYVAHIDNGTVVHEATKKDTGVTTPSQMVDVTTIPTMVYDGTTFEADEATLPLTYATTLDDGKRLKLTSGGHNMGNTCSCLLDNGEQSGNERGINVVVYDNDIHSVVASANFDTFKTSTRTLTNYEEDPFKLVADGTSYADLSADMKNMYRYNLRAIHQQRARQVERGEHVPYVAQYLGDYLGNAQLRLLIAVKGDGAQMLSAEDCAALSDMGLTQLAGLGYQGAYCGVINPDGSIQEQSTVDGSALTMAEDGYSVSSAGTDGGDYATIRLASGGYAANHASGESGISVVVYDPTTGAILDETVFTKVMREAKDIPPATPVPTTGTGDLTQTTEQTAAATPVATPAADDAVANDTAYPEELEQ